MKKSFICESEAVLLLEFLTDKLAFISRGQLKKQLSLREIKVNSKRVCENINLKKGDEVSIFLPEHLEKNEQSIELIYADDNIVIVDKPILCDIENHLITLLKKSYPSIRAVHRLDRNTKGLVVFALNDEAYTELKKAFKQRRVEKYYTALVAGVVKKDSETLKAYLKKAPQEKLCYVSKNPSVGASEIITSYEVIRRYEDTTQLYIKLQTGKTHQIRAHLAFIGHPIIGDSKYGSNAANRKAKQKYQCLIAQKLEFKGLTGKISYLNHREFKRKNID